MNFKKDIRRAETQVKRYARKVYPSERDYIKFVQGKLKPNEYVCSGMGSLSISRVNLTLLDEEQKDVETKFAQWLNDFEWDNDKHFPHTLPYMFNSKRIITNDIEKKIRLIHEEFKEENPQLRKQMPSLNFAFMQYLFNGKLSKEIYSNIK